jgi:uncharacterized membrane protein YgcG
MTPLNTLFTTRSFIRTQWRTTRKIVWRRRAWRLWRAIDKHCRIETGGFSGVVDVAARDGKVVHDDVQPSYFIAETLKYLFLIFDDDDGEDDGDGGDDNSDNDVDDDIVDKDYDDGGDDVGDDVNIGGANSTATFPLFLHRRRRRRRRFDRLPLHSWVFNTEAHPMPMRRRCASHFYDEDDNDVDNGNSNRGGGGGSGGGGGGGGGGSFSGGGNGASAYVYDPPCSGRRNEEWWRNLPYDVFAVGVTVALLWHFGVCAARACCSRGGHRRCCGCRGRTALRCCRCRPAASLPTVHAATTEGGFLRRCFARKGRKMA